MDTRNNFKSQSSRVPINYMCVPYTTTVNLLQLLNTPKENRLSH